MPKPKFTTTTTTNQNNNKTAPKSKKRKRLEKLQQYGVDLPEIPGVPVEVIPLLVHALKTATKFFQHETSSVYNDDWERHGSSGNDELYPQASTTTATSTNNSNALDNVLNRIDSAAQDSEEVKQQKQRKEKMQDATQTWLQAVKRNTKRDQRHTNNEEGLGSTQAVDNHNNQQQYHTKARPSVPLSCFTYMWNLGQDHKRLAVRRAALYMNRLLLDKSADCRKFFLEESSHLWQWVQMLCSSSPNFEAAKQRLWQREGHKLLLHLLEEHYDDLYPKLKVSEQYLRQACLLPSSTTVAAEGDEEDEDAVTTTNMTSLRNLRDIALQHGKEEMKRVDKLIQRSYKCTDILVPRMTLEEDSSSTKQLKQPAKDSLVHDAEEDDDDDIDWEDGWEADGTNEDEDDDEDNDESHAKAVERTLEAMAAMGTGLRTGGVQIDFNKVAKLDDSIIVEPSLAAASNGPEAVAARERLTKCARFLSERHLPRIRAWIEGLAKADRLKQQQGGGPLLLMSPQQGQERDELREKLIHAKAQVMGVLESAASLGLCSLKE